MEEIISVLFHSRTQAHIFHLQTDSYAQHIALNKYYDGIVGLADGLAEAWQGKYGKIQFKAVNGIEQYKGLESVVAYFEKILKIVEEKRKAIKESYIQNLIDGVEELIYSTLYLLKELK